MSGGHEHCTPQAFERSEFRVLEELRHHVFVCADAGTFCGCEAAGSATVLAALRKEIARQRLGARCKITLMHCRQAGARGPMVVIYPDAVWYEGLTVEAVPELVASHIIAGVPLERFGRQAPLQGVADVPLHIVAPAGS